MTPDPRAEIFRRAERSVIWHPRESPKQSLARLAAWTPEGVERDNYGRGGPVAALEEQVAALLGKPAAVFMPSGTMAQPIALRLWCEERGRPRVAFHPLCHLEVHEHRGYRHLHGLDATLLGAPTRPVRTGDLEALVEPPGAVLLELPQRDLGGVLPSWEELQAQVGAARALGAAVHCDGARLWECQPFYGRPLAKIAALFDSVYVSFYKTLGAISGAILAGPEDFVAAARIWQRRQGGNVVALFPEALSCLEALERRLPRIPDYVAAAQRLAAELADLPGVRLGPAEPQVNMFQLYLSGDREALLDACAAATEATGLRFVSQLADTEVPGWGRFEVCAGDCTLALAPGEARSWLERVLGAVREG